MLGIGTCAFVATGGMAVGEQEFGPVCDRHLREIAVGDYHQAYVEADSVLRASMTEEQFANLERGLKERVGAVRSKKVGAVEAGLDEQGRWVGLTYECEFDKGSGTIEFVLRKRSDGWKVVSIRYNSPQLEEFMRSAMQKMGAPQASDL